MASGFLFLEDGRGLSTRESFMGILLGEILIGLREDEEAKEFADYISKYVPTDRHERSHMGGFFDPETGEFTYYDIDLREFTVENQKRFWKAAQKRLGKLIAKEKEEIHDKNKIYYLKILLDMHKRIKRGENPMELNHMRIAKPPTGLRKGPGWEDKE